MTGNIEQRIYALARRYNGVYLINNEKNQQLLNASNLPLFLFPILRLAC